MAENDKKSERVSIRTSDLLACPPDLIQEHWEYIGALLRVHGESDAYEKIKFHYKTAFAHGWKHAIEEMSG